MLLTDISYVGKQNCNTGKFKDFSYMYNDFYLTNKKKKKKKKKKKNTTLWNMSESS